MTGVNLDDQLPDVNRFLSELPNEPDELSKIQTGDTGCISASKAVSPFGDWGEKTDHSYSAKQRGCTRLFLAKG
ncbi:hypothetical protein DYU11_12650 [Fibrisoma montanum]|uniref:Uncharacterized protein n=1 Tax=Fibrisoma montanum TaxID=2305895 RepID=A0A418MBR3_9BACT|nr:hypothetical protein DYU11_12650 [Fibrisoma montanum]